MNNKKLPIVSVKLDNIVGGGRTIGTLADGRKIFVWGGLPDETVNVQITKKKSKLAEGIVTEVIESSSDRVEPNDKVGYLSTSPWQIMNFEAEQNYKVDLIKDAYKLSNITLSNTTEIYSDSKQFEYRNKIEFSWYYNKVTEQLDLAFFQRGTHSKVPVEGTSLANPSINIAALAVRDLLRQNPDVKAYNLKTLLVRCDKKGNVAMQLYVTDPDFTLLSDSDIKKLQVKGFELIFSNPKSPASVITKRLQSWGTTKLTDTILNIPFSYDIEGFFQINIPVYEQALLDMKQWVSPDQPTVDLYSGVGTIGLTIGGPNVTLVEINESAVNEMKRNILTLNRTKTTKVVLAPSEKALEYITSDSTIIIDPPRAGLHEDVIAKLLEALPERIIYLSCNPVTQARDIAQLLEKYNIVYNRGYNFFPKTPHIEHLAVLNLIK
jgi:23S rRNA (uracil1939-C5)-methyltransferase